MKFNYRTEIPQLLLIVGMFIMAAFTWSTAPDLIPIHWNLAGEVDDYGGKFEALLGIPLITLAVYFLLLFVPRIDPGYMNYQKFASTYTIIRCSIIAFMSIIYGVIQLTILGHPISVNAIIPFAVGILFVVLGNFMGKIRPNWFVGIRTPWTLSSKASWNKTHRASGWLFILMGLSITAAGLIRSQWAYLGMFAVIVICFFWMVFYSYLVWRNDPDRIPPAGTTPGPG
ncbi:MAG: SdpI family protein [Planctomycetes bacterium]|nr:SdpI family protein [Planctomycetota bacterium]MCH9726666.1 SdpI family protein [Planctomycetota bacterium]MCH9779574.1 SdpI family protein [Planctomycetota bacterium]MCH9793031.1 SdpI family protein [Planctomycetota bacterium]